MSSKINWADALRAHGARSWQEVLEPGEQLGGPTPWGSSKWALFKQCPYLYWMQHVARMRWDRHEEPLEIGGLFHEAKARYYQAYLDRRLDGDDWKLDYVDEQCVQAGWDIINRADEVVPHITGVVRRLWETWLVLRGPGTAGDTRAQTWAVEYYLEQDEPFPYSTRIDRVLKDDSQYYGVEETKTAKERDGYLISSYRMDSQFLGQQYLWINQEPDKPMDRYVIDLSTKTNPPSHTIEVTPIDRRMLADWEHEMRHAWREFQVYQKLVGRWPRRRQYRCRYCQAFDHCASRGQSWRGWKNKHQGEY